jgi:hypothetical protein
MLFARNLGKLSVIGAALLSTLLLGCAGSGEVPTDSGGSGGSSGDAGKLPEGCAQAAAIFTAHTCTTICHKAEVASAYGGFDMTTPGWEKRLVGAGPPSNAPPSNMCKGKGFIYLNKTQPATGLFLDKLGPTPPCGVRMPQLLNPLSSTEIACVQKWANNVVAGGSGQ